MPTEMDLTYKRRFSDAKIPEAYEALILDAIKGDHSNFVRHDELDVAWKVRRPRCNLYAECLTWKSDFYANFALDRGQGWPAAEACAIPLRISWAQRA